MRHASAASCSCVASRRHVVGAKTLMDWDPIIASQSLALFEERAMVLLHKYGGYLVGIVHTTVGCSQHLGAHIIWHTVLSYTLYVQQAAAGRRTLYSCCSLMKLAGADACPVCIAAQNVWQVECAEGFVLASFARPAAAVRWAMQCNRDMVKIAWPEELLGHELVRS